VENGQRLAQAYLLLRRDWKPLAVRLEQAGFSSDPILRTMEGIEGSMRNVWGRNGIGATLQEQRPSPWRYYGNPPKPSLPSWPEDKRTLLGFALRSELRADPQVETRSVTMSSELTPSAQPINPTIITQEIQGQRQEIQGQRPRVLLTGWREIMAALEMTHKDYDKVKSLNERYQGPIVTNGQGTQPMVYKDELINWWNKLASRQQELVSQREGAKLSAEAQHDYSREGIVAPEIGDGVKKRRRSKST
jgi:hypothetical protein